MSPAELTLVIVLCTSVLVAVVAVARAVRADGLGTRPAPRSHLTWDHGGWDTGETDGWDGPPNR